MPEHRMWPPAGQRSATTGIYTPERSDGPELAALRRDWPRYDTWHREGIASDATMPPLGEGEPWMPATYLERLRRQYMVHLHDGGAPSDIEAAQGLLHALRALGPKEPAVALVPAPRDPVAARAAFEAEGYLYYPPGEVLGPAELRALQLRFAQEEPAARQRWREELRAAGAEGLGHTGDRMISVGDTEEWFASAGGLLHACMGASPLPTALEAIFGGAAVCRGAGARILPPEQPVIGAGPMGAPQGYVSWHRDWHESDGESRGDPRPDLKLLINVEDVASIDQAPTAIVPGSHLVSFGAGQLQHDVGRLFGGYGYGRGDHQSLMPNALAFVAPAGSALLIDTRTWHTAYPNLSQKDRRNVIAMFQPAKEGDRPFVAANEADKKSKL